MFKHPLPALVGMALLSLPLAGCTRNPDLPPVIGPEGEAEARTAFVQLLEALESGDQDKVWEGLSARSQSRVKEKVKAAQTLRGIVGRKPRIKEGIKRVQGTRSGVEVEFEYAPGKTRELEMVPEGGAWKLNLFSS
jgi:hypothetical protein